MRRILLASVCIAAARSAVATGADEALAADAAFAAMSADRGQQAAFDEYLVADAIVFSPDPVLAREWSATHERGSGRLAWTPDAAFTDCSGRWAVTSGPWTYSRPDDGERSSGHYVSIWRREADGRWRVVVDDGTDHENRGDREPSLRAAFASLWPASPVHGRGAGEAAAKLRAAEQSLNDAIRSGGMHDAMSGVASAGAVAFRDDAEPGPLASVIDAAYPRGSQPTSLYAAADDDSDLGYSYGVIEARSETASTAPSRGAYLRIWHWDGHQWRVVVDMLTPVEERGSP